MLRSLGIETMILTKDAPSYNLWPLAEATEGRDSTSRLWEIKPHLGRDLLHEDIVVAGSLTCSSSQLVPFPSVWYEKNRIKLDGKSHAELHAWGLAKYYKALPLQTFICSLSCRRP